MRQHRKLTALASAVALLLGIASVLPIPGSGAREICAAYVSSDRKRFRNAVGSLRYDGMTLMERAREARAPFPPSLDCVVSGFVRRGNPTRFCRQTPPTTRAEHAVRDLRFKKAFLESQIECLEELRRERLGAAPPPR